MGKIEQVVKTFKELIELPKAERNQYVIKHLQAIDEAFEGKEFQALLIGLCDDAVYMDDYRCMNYLSEEQQQNMRRRYWKVTQANIEGNYLPSEYVMVNTDLVGRNDGVYVEVLKKKLDLK